MIFREMERVEDGKWKMGDGKWMMDDVPRTSSLVSARDDTELSVILRQA